MGSRARSVGLAIISGLVHMACGAGGPTMGSEDASPQNADATAETPFLGEAGAPCQSDAECPAGYACVEVQLGEITQRSCALRADAGADGGSAGPGDASSSPLDAASRPTDAGIDGNPGMDAGSTRDAGADSGACSNMLTVLITSVSPDPRPKCYLNTSVDTASPATLTYPCGGGAASVTFGSQTFTGTEANGSVTLQNLSTYPMVGFGISCMTDATQTISGDLRTGTLQYTYSEVIEKNQSSLCDLVFLPCSASGPVTVQ